MNLYFLLCSVNNNRGTYEKYILTNEGLDSIRVSYIVGEKLSGSGGVKLLAIDEFEKEHGGYQSEHEGYGTKSRDGGEIHMEKISISKDSSRKKRKRLERVQCSKYVLLFLCNLIPFCKENLVLIVLG